VVHIPVKMTPARFADCTLTVILFVEVLVVEVLVVELVVVEELLVVELVVVVGFVVVDVELMVVVVVRDDVRVKARFVFPCRENVAVPPPPVALVLVKVPTLAAVT